MIHFIIATVSEAKPLINFYSLKKKKTFNFTFYSNDQISLTISGIGKINAMSVTQHFMSLIIKKIIYGLILVFTLVIKMKK